MKRKTFYTLTGAFLLVLMGLFSLQLFSMPERQCLPSVSEVCMILWNNYCWDYYGGPNMGWSLLMSGCDLGDCIGFYKIKCDGAFGNSWDYGYCVSEDFSDRCPEN